MVICIENRKMFNEKILLLVNLKVYNGMTQLGFEMSHHDFRYVISIIYFVLNLTFLNVSTYF